MVSLAKDIGSTVVEGLTTAGIAAAGSYFFDSSSRYQTDLFGIAQLPEWQINGILAGASSLVGNGLGQYAIPMVADKFVGNATLGKILVNGLPPAITGGTYVAAKKFGTDSDSGAAKDFLIAGGSHLVATQFVTPLFY